MSTALNVYLEHDLPDTKFASIVANCLQSLRLFNVVVSDCERIRDFNSTKKSELDKCDLFVLLLGTISPKAKLIQKEIEIVESRNALVVPFYMGQLHKIWRLIPSLSSYQENFVGRDEKAIAIRLLQVVQLMESKFHVSVETIRKAREKLAKYKPMRERQEGTVNRRKRIRLAFIELIREIFERLGYNVDKRYVIRTVFVTEFFDMQVSKDKKDLWVKCFAGPPSKVKVSKILSILPENEVCWIIYRGRKVSDQLYSLVQGANVFFVEASHLAKKVKNSVERDYFLRKIDALAYGDLENYWEDQRFLELINSPKQMGSPAILEVPILQLNELIKKRETSESKYQELIQKNPWILGAQYESIQDQKRFNDENIPDFIGVRTRDGSSDIIEIKQPFLELFREDKKFNSNFNDAWNQIEKYLSFAREEKDYLRRKGLNFDNPKCLLIAGYKIEPSCLKKIRAKERLNPAIEVITYDQLISYAEKTVRFLREMASSEAKA